MSTVTDNMNIPTFPSSHSNTGLPDEMFHLIVGFLDKKDIGSLGTTIMANNEFLGVMTTALETRRKVEKTAIENLLKSQVRMFIDTGFMDTAIVFMYDKLNYYIDQFGLYDDSIISDDGTFKYVVEFTSNDWRRSLFEMVLDLIPDQAFAFTMKHVNVKPDDYGFYPYTIGNLRVAISNTKTITSGIDKHVNIVIIGGNTTSIGNDAFYCCSNMTNIVIPDSVTSIDEYAFASCSSMTNIVIPDSVTSIGEFAFADCVSMTSIVIPNSVTSIGYGAFNGCSNMTNIVIPDSVTSIGHGVFHGCSSMTNIVIPDSVTSIGGFAFAGCSSMTNIVIPNSVTSIGDSAFNGCSNMTNIVIPDSVTSIGEFIFYGCSSMTNIMIPNSVTRIREHAFVETM
jgi:hypothetical protein